MNIDGWMVLAFAAGLMSVIAYYRHSRWLSGLILLGLPIMAVAVLGWPRDTDFIDTFLLSIVLWVVLSLIGVAVGTTAVVLRVIR